MKNILTTFSLLIFLVSSAFAQIKFDDAFKITKKRTCYDLNIEKIDFSNKKVRDTDTKIFTVKIQLNNIGTMIFEQSANAHLELYDLTGTKSIKLESWNFNNLEIDDSKTFEWEVRYSPEDIFPTKFEAKIVLNGTLGECNLFNNSRLEEYEF